MDEMMNNIEEAMDTNVAEITAKASVNGGDVLLGSLITLAIGGVAFGIKKLVDHNKMKKLEEDAIHETIEPIEDVGSVE